MSACSPSSASPSSRTDWSSCTSPGGSSGAIRTTCCTRRTAVRSNSSASRTDGQTLRSPFTDTECLAYEYEVQEERNTQHGQSWERIASGREAVPFRLRDETGSVLVEPPGADIRLDREARITVEGGERPPERIARFIERDERVDDQNRSIDLGVVGIDRDALDRGRLGWYRYRIFGLPFLGSDSDERGTVKRIGVVGLAAAFGGGVGLGVLALVLG